VYQLLASNDRVLHGDAFRFERKFIVADRSRYEIEGLIRLHAAHFKAIYPRRYVNNIYFDTQGFRNYFDNLQGVANRMKVRMRWYGGLFGPANQPVLELKTKLGFLGYKRRFLLSDFKLVQGMSADDMLDCLKHSELPLDVKSTVSAMQPVLFNRYSRSYWLSADKRFRLTVDSEMTCNRIDRPANFFLGGLTDRVSSILELKYAEDDDKDAYRISEHFPFRPDKSSKYISGLEKTYADILRISTV
jgi:VTC domain-containing protein